MLDKLLAYLRNRGVEDNTSPSAIPDVSAMTSNSDQMDASPVMKHGGRSTHLGYNYLKGMDGHLEDSSKHIRRFHNLNKLLRGTYHGKIEASHATEDEDIRGEDTE